MNSKITATAAAVTAGIVAAAAALTSCAAASAPANTPPAPSVRPLNGGSNMESIQWTRLPNDPYTNYTADITTFCYAGVQFYVTETNAGSVAVATSMQNGSSAGDC
jgi:hypothetical protein